MDHRLVGAVNMMVVVSAAASSGAVEECESLIWAGKNRFNPTPDGRTVHTVVE